MKIKKVNEEISRVKTKISDLQGRLRELERQKTELENSEIVELVRSCSMTAEQLKVFMQSVKGQNPKEESVIEN